MSIRMGRELNYLLYIKQFPFKSESCPLFLMTELIKAPKGWAKRKRNHFTIPTGPQGAESSVFVSFLMHIVI